MKFSPLSVLALGVRGTGDVDGGVGAGGADAVNAACLGARNGGAVFR